MMRHRVQDSHRVRLSSPFAVAGNQEATPSSRSSPRCSGWSRSSSGGPARAS